MKRRPPSFLILGGTNGAGKSFFANSALIPRGYAYMNPDAVQRIYGLSPQETGRRILQFIRQRLTSCSGSLALETTFSGYEPIKLIQEARGQGWYTSLVFLATCNPEINLRNIAARVQNGGHDIPKDTVMRRYERAFVRLGEAMNVVDEILIYDNSDLSLRASATIFDGELVLLEDCPDWLAERVSTLFLQSKNRL